MQVHWSIFLVKYYYKGGIYMENTKLECDGTVSATQPSMVDGGKVDVFTNNSKDKELNIHNIYDLLFELNDYEI